METTGSSPLSWRTAFSTPHTPEVTMLDENEELPLEDTRAKYRTAKEMPHELRMSCKIHLEEKLFSNALTLENELLTCTSNPDAPSFVPPISHISLISTLLVHPSHTTRARDLRERCDTLSKALNYLRNLLAIVGPCNARLNEAFAFRPQDYRQHHIGSRRKRNSSDSPPDSEDVSCDELNLLLATSESVWTKAQDFWQIVGWAFNCSVAFPDRWEYWKIWLGYMVDVIDADYLERNQVDVDALEELKKVDPDAEEPFDARNDSLLSHYIDGERGRSHVKRVMRSIFANGEDNSLKEFTEVFTKETTPRKEVSSRKRQKFGQVDLENGKFGDYCSSDDEVDVKTEPNSSQQEATPPASSPERDHIHADEDDLSVTLGGHESMALRLRLMALVRLLRASSQNISRAIPITDLYDYFGENLRLMPIDSLSLFINTSAIPLFPSNALSSLCQLTLTPLIDDEALQPKSDDLDVDTLVTNFLPWAACTTSIEDNAKLSLLIETLLRLFVQDPNIKYESSLDDFAALKEAVEKGIEARESKNTSGKRRKRSKSASNADDSAKFWLQCSSERMRLLMPVYEKKLLKARLD